MSDKETKERITNDKEFLNWIYERMICVYGEKDLYDYMINFKSVIDRVDERPKAWNEAIESVKEVLQELELKECEYKECAVPENLNYEYFKGKRDAYEFSVKLIRRALEWQGEQLKHKQP